MECLVTPDLTNESIVSRKDAEAVGAITVDRADTNIEPKERNLTKLKNTQKNIKQKPTKEYQDHMANKRNRGLRQRSRDRSTNRSYSERDHHNERNEIRGRKKIRRSAENPAQATPDTPEAPTNTTNDTAQETPDTPDHSSTKETFDTQLSKSDQKIVDEKIQEWFATYSCLSDTLPDKPMKGPPMKINVRTDIKEAPPKAFKAAPWALHFKKPGDALIEDLKERGIIKQIGMSEVGPFCTRAFLRAKPGGIEKGVRLVNDFSKVNKWIIRPTHPFISGPDLLKRIPHNAVYLCKLDFLWGFYQIPIHKDSQYLTAMITELGVFIYLRGAMGLNATGDEFNRRSDEAIHGLDGILKLIDDILVYASTLEELFQRVEAVLQRCQERNMTLSKKKLQIGKRLTFAGFVISGKGVEPTDERMKAIREYPTPKDITTLRGFLGIAQTIGHFLPDLAHAANPLVALTTKDGFFWNDDMDKVLQDCKNILTSPAVLKLFNPKLHTFLITDASRIGLGFLLVQKEDPKQASFHVIQCGSRSTSGAESRYAVCELEGLALMWSMKKCNFYLAGMPHFTVLTDHKSLRGVYDKDICDVENVRLQKYRENTQQYSFNVEHIEGKLNAIGDALSRNPVLPAEPEDPDTCVCKAIKRLTDNEDPILTPLINAAEEDVEYQLLKESILDDTTTCHLPADHPANDTYKNVWKSLSVHANGLIVYDNKRILVPKACRKDILNKLHIAHCGVDKSTMRANMDYWWPNLAPQLDTLINGCSPCIKEKPSQQIQPIINTNTTTAPMQVVGLDFFQLAGKDYLLMVDQYSGFPLVCRMPTTTTSALIKEMKQWFNFCGYPEKCISDGGPQFRTEFKEFCEKFNIKHDPSSAYHAQGNGLAESAVKNTKTLLKKLGKDWDKFMLALLEWRNMPNKASGWKSPAQMFFGRRQRTLLPMLPGATNFDINAAVEGAEKRKTNRDNEYKRRNTKDLAPLAIGQKVLIQTPEGWDTKAIVLGSSHGQRSYDVRTEGGAEKRLNRRILMPAPDSETNDQTEISDKSSDEVTSNTDEIPEGTLHEVAEKKPDIPLRRSARKPAVHRGCYCCKVIQCKENLQTFLL